MYTAWVRNTKKTPVFGSFANSTSRSHPREMRPNLDTTAISLGILNFVGFTLWIFCFQKRVHQKPPKFPKWPPSISKPGHFEEPKRSRTIGLYLSEPFERGLGPNEYPLASWFSRRDLFSSLNFGDHLSNHLKGHVFTHHPKKVTKTCQETKVYMGLIIKGPKGFPAIFPMILLYLRSERSRTWLWVLEASHVTLAWRSGAKISHKRAMKKRGPEQLFRGFVGDEILRSYVGNIL